VDGLLSGAMPSLTNLARIVALKSKIWKFQPQLDGE
jgi:hypothetical protein